MLPAGTARPLESTRKGLRVAAGIFTVRRSPVLSPPIRELVAAGTLSVTAMENWVGVLTAKTVPSTKSCWVAFNGSNSLSSSVPSDLRKASTLAIWPAAAQLFGALGQRFLGTGL